MKAEDFVSPKARTRDFYGPATPQSVELDRRFAEFLDQFQEMRRQEAIRVGRCDAEDLEHSIETIRQSLLNLVRMLSPDFSDDQLVEYVFQMSLLVGEGFILGANIGGGIGQELARRPLREGAKRGASKSIAVRRARSASGWEAEALVLARKLTAKNGAMVRDHLASEIITLWTSEEVQPVGHGSLLKFLALKEAKGEIPLSRAAARKKIVAPSKQ